MLVLVPSLGILLFNYDHVTESVVLVRVLVPSLGILLFNKVGESMKYKELFSSPLWGFFYLMIL